MSVRFAENFPTELKGSPKVDALLTIGGPVSFSTFCLVPLMNERMRKL